MEHEASNFGPKHVAVIMDGNGRWAQTRGLTRLAGHARGVERVREIVKAAPDFGLTHLTLFAFSTENWKRSGDEVMGLMKLFRIYISKEASKLVDRNVRVRFIGERGRLDDELQRLMKNLEEKTQICTGLNMTIALNYGGRDELLRAVNLALKGDKKEINFNEFERFLDTSDIPDPDLVIRTSGESRISNFLLWQAAYAEYDFIPISWPDFTVDHFEASIERFRLRDRRFGGVKT